MSNRYVVILSSRGLFREGLRYLLAEVATVILAASPQEVADLLNSEQVDVVVVDQKEDPTTYLDFLFRLLSSYEVRVVTVRLDVSDIQVYRCEQVPHASPEALIAAVVGLE